MTKKQIFLLTFLTILALCGAVLFGAWRFRSARPAAEILPSRTPEIEMGANTAQEINVDESTITNWPTITPRVTTVATPTPQPVVYEQISRSQDQQPTVTLDSDNIQSELVQSTPVFTPEATMTTFSFVNISEDESPFTIGQSVQGQDLWMHKFGSGETQKLIVAGIHGGYEYNTTDLAYELISYIQTNPQVIPEDTTLYILPSFNPDGLSRSQGYAGRANANNVDLNRNWDFNWKSTWNPAGCWAYLPIEGGSSPFSEPETAALRDFIHSHNISALISYHSAALGVFPGGAPDIDLSIGLAETIAQVVPYPYPPIQTGCEITGQFVDYASSYGIPALDIELTNHKDSDFEINLEVLKAFLRWSP